MNYFQNEVRITNLTSKKKKKKKKKKCIYLIIEIDEYSL